MRWVRRFLPALTVSALPAFAEPLAFIDTQAQFDPQASSYPAALEVMLREMDRAGISKTLIVPPPFAKSNRNT